MSGPGRESPLSEGAESGGWMIVSSERRVVTAMMPRGPGPPGFRAHAKSRRGAPQEARAAWRPGGRDQTARDTSMFSIDRSASMIDHRDGSSVGQPRAKRAGPMRRTLPLVGRLGSARYPG
jgi:hypothetical protein